jgi:phosphocarrier protein HPr
MKSFTYLIQDEMGIHARPAGLLVKTAKQFQSTIMLVRNEESIRLDRLIALMNMAVKQGQKVTITADGVDEDAALDALKVIFQERL